MQTTTPVRTHPRTDQNLADAIRDAGVVGAGGAGFPSYVKYKTPTPILLVNGAESEPGYYADKLLFKERAREFARLFVFLKDVECYERIIVAVEQKAEPFMGEMETLAEATDAFEVFYIENVYKYGQEKALIKRVLEREVPKQVLPADVGVTVNNNETLLNVYRAIFEARPVTTKFLTVYGETPEHIAVEAPVGAYATDLLALAGVEDVDPEAGLCLYDGGPVLCDEVADWLAQPYGIRKVTNGLLLVSAENKKKRAKAYPAPGKANPPRRIEDVSRFIRRVRVPLGGRFGTPAKPIVDPGEVVHVNDTIGEVPRDKLGVPVHASITGRVTAVTPEHVEITADDAEAWLP